MRGLRPTGRRDRTIGRHRRGTGRMGRIRRDTGLGIVRRLRLIERLRGIGLRLRCMGTIGRRRGITTRRAMRRLEWEGHELRLREMSVQQGQRQGMPERTVRRLRRRGLRLRRLAMLGRLVLRRVTPVGLQGTNTRASSSKTGRHRRSARRRRSFQAASRGRLAEAAATGGIRISFPPISKMK